MEKLRQTAQKYKQKKKNGKVLICENTNEREINKINHLELLKIYVLQTKLYGKLMYGVRTMCRPHELGIQFHS